MRFFFSPPFIYLLLLGVVGLSLHGGEADVELLDDGWVQAVEVEQQHELVVETYHVSESHGVRLLHKHESNCRGYRLKIRLTNFGIQHQTSSIGCFLFPFAFPYIHVLVAVVLVRSEGAVCDLTVF